MFNRLKKFVGIVNVKVEITNPPEFLSPSQGQTGIIVRVTAEKEDVYLNGATLSLYEEFSYGRGDNRKTETTVLGKVTYSSITSENLIGKIKDYDAAMIKAGDSKDLFFMLVYKAPRVSNFDKLKESGGVLGGLGKLASTIDNEETHCYLEAVIDLKDVFIDPSAKLEIPVKG